MKRIISYLLLALLAFSSCRKDNNDSVFPGTTDERINKALGDYQSALESAQFGWNARLVTATGSIYNFHFSFNNTNRVLMFGDIDTLTASERKGKQLPPQSAATAFAHLRYLFLPPYSCGP